jgi:hypothetical protein
MNSIADALVYAVTYLCTRDTEDEDLIEEDDSAVSHIMAYLHDATPAEEEALAEAAKKALAEEQSLITPEPVMIEHFSMWMEHIFGRDWEGNERVYPS